jgi:hypothetical protein
MLPLLPGVLLLVTLPLPATLQSLGSLDAPPARTRQYITFTAEQQIVPAGRRAVLDLRFHVQEGYHVNSHTPRSELLIPTRIELEPAANVKLLPAEYPGGTSFSFSFNPSEKLDVYADDFIVKLPLTAAAGEHELHGTLKYQACDHAACYPPKTLPISVIFTAK